MDLLKRAFDVALASVSAAILFPLALLIALAIQVESRGPLLYNSERVGRHGRPFRYHRLRLTKGWSFRSPYEYTRLGRVAGNLSLDEIPALWNVLRGEMSFVGPRAERPELVDLADPDWQTVLSVRPGLTGLGVLTFLESYNRTGVQERIRPEVYYAENWSPLLDAKVLAKTLFLWVRMGHLKGRF